MVVTTKTAGARMTLDREHLLAAWLDRTVLPRLWLDAIVCRLLNFIYKRVYAPTKTQKAQYLGFWAFVKIFLGAIVFQRSCERRQLGNAQEDSLTRLIIAVYAQPEPVLDSGNL